MMQHVVILDISGVYAQIYDQGFYKPSDIETIKHTYSDTKHWKVVMVD